MRTLRRSLSRATLVVAAPVGATLALLSVAALSLPSSTAAFSLTGESLGLDQRDFRVFNNFSDPSANDNTIPHPNFPGHTGAVMAIWKAHSEWGSGPRGGNGLGDGVSSNPNLGDGGANFDNTFQGLAPNAGGQNGNVHSQGASLGGSLLAFTATPVSDGWQIVYNGDFAWEDGPGPVDSGLDLQGVATHEIGHTLGVGHSAVSGATMHASLSGTGTSARSLSADDIAGIQAVYGVAAASKPRIDATSGATATGAALTLTGANFAAIGNEVWFTAAAGDGTPVKLLGVPSSAGGTRIDVVVPAGVASGDVLVKTSGASGASLSNAFPIAVDMAPGDYVITGPGLGAPHQLTGEGDLMPGGAGFAIHLNLLSPGVPGALFLSTNEANLPFKGGVFDPAPILLQIGLVGPPGGLLSFGGTMPAAVPSGTGFVMQAWFSSGPSAFSATNGLRLDVP